MSRQNQLRSTLWIIVISMGVLLASVPVLGSTTLNQSEDPIYQISVINALLEGIYDGVMTFEDLKAYGDFGLGTFHAVDGEMVADRGRFYRVRVDGLAYPVADHDTTPFSVVTFFNPELKMTLDHAMSQGDVEQLIFDLMGTTNAPYAIRITGSFSVVKTRSVEAQSKPYPRLADVTANQAEFDFSDVRGTMIGFYTPEYLNGINIPGFHFHFLTEDLRHGGHVLSYQLKQGTLEMDEKNRVITDLPMHLEDFRAKDFSTQVEGELERIEN